MFVFTQMERLAAVVSESLDAVVAAAFARSVSLSHFGISHSVSHLPPTKDHDFLKAQITACSSKNVFLSQCTCFFRHDATAHFIDEHTG